MKPEADHATLIDLAARLERSNAAPRGVDAPVGSELRMAPTERKNQRRPASAAVARLPQPRTNSHAAAYLGAGAVILGLLCLVFLGQATL